MTSRLPDFLVIGAAKCGTIWINHCLRDHPDLHLPGAVNETMFFDRYYERGASWYAGYFRGHRGAKCVGEVAPTYFENRQVPSRVRTLLPSATLVVSLRNPVDRARSMYLHHWRKGDVPPEAPFRDACRAQARILEGGRYGAHATRWLDHFARGQLHLFVLEESAGDPVGYISGIYRALGVDSGFESPSIRLRFNEHRTPRSILLSRVAHRASRALHRQGLHKAVELGKRLRVAEVVFRPGSGRLSAAPPLAAEDRRWLVDEYREDVRSLEALLGRSLSRVWPDFAEDETLGRGTSG